MVKILNRIFSMSLMALALFAFFVAIGYATFVENDYGTPVAQKLIYRARWFEVIIVYLTLSMLFNIYRYKLVQLKKIGTLLFHISFVIIVLGAAFTRYFGFEGVMTIREGAASNEIISAETYFQIKVHDSIDQYTHDMQLILEEETNNYFEHEVYFKEEKQPINFEFVSLVDNVKDTIVPTSKKEGDPYIDIVIPGQGGMQSNFIKSGEVANFGAFKIAFNNDAYTDAIRLSESDSGIVVRTPFDLSYLPMSAMRAEDRMMDSQVLMDSLGGIVERDSAQIFELKRLYQFSMGVFVFNTYYPAAKRDFIKKKEKGDVILKAVTVKVTQGDLSKEVLLLGGKGLNPSLAKFKMGNLYYELAFGSKVEYLPFSLALRDFQLETYPGTNRPSSFASEVTIVDMEKNYTEDYRIFMNNVLDYRGYRFFQADYDHDDAMGTVLSVNQDKLGTNTTYIGYALLGLGFIVNLFSRGSRFRMLMKKARDIRIKRENLMAIVVLLGLSTGGYSQVADGEKMPFEGKLIVVDEEHADKYGRLLIQHGERIKPVHTLAMEVLRKVHRKDKYNDYTAMQVFLGIHTDAWNWRLEPMIYVSGQPIRDKLNLEGKYASLADFFNLDMEYLLNEDADKALQKKPAMRSQYDKDVIKTDERVNILFGMFTGLYLKILPLPNDTTNTWYSPFDPDTPFEGEDRDFFNSVVPMYNSAVGQGVATGDWTLADKMIEVIDLYQRRVAPEDIMPSKRKVEIEIFYNELNVFKKLMNGYLLFGLFLLIIQFVKVFKPAMNVKWPMRVGMWCFLLMFALHGLGLGLRWYISGHAPWSNGYEAVVFIGFVTVLAGLMFSRKNQIVLGSTGILAWLMLFVAHMNSLDPEITQLVPVLKSYWLMIHVAIITGSYGFLGLGAIIGLMILVMNLFLNQGNKKRVLLTTKELTHISEMTITIGLFMLTIGTFLGGVWANESWGRYWGWDAKETWALASVLIYAVLLHLRFIPFLKSQFAFNTMSLWAYASIIMTFFGVNFYLSGLHSYAQGDPIPVPTWVPISVVALILLNAVSYVVHKRVTAGAKEESEEVE